MAIQMNAVISSNVESVGYEPKTKTLAVKFRDGGTYHYADVTPEKYEAMKGAKSKGGFLHKEIRRFHRGTRQD